MAKCRHNFRPSSWNVPPATRALRKKNWPDITVQCTKCKEVVKRPMTKEEIRIYRKDWLESQKESKGLHKLWHEFARKFMGPKGWKLNGYEFMEAVEQYAKKHPEIIITGCDDEHFASSDIVLIPHRHKDYYMGTTMLIIPQLVGEPCQVFLYPNHAEALIEAIKGTPLGKQPDWEKIYKRNTKRLLANCRRRAKRRQLKK